MSNAVSVDPTLASDEGDNPPGAISQPPEATGAVVVGESRYVKEKISRTQGRVKSPEGTR